MIDVVAEGLPSSDPSIFAAATFDDQQMDLGGRGRAIVRGLKPKTYRVIIGLPFRRGAVVPFEVTALGEGGARRVLRVKLP